MERKPPNTLVSAILLFTNFVFMAGVIAFSVNHSKNVTLKEQLESSGIRATAHVISLDEEVSRKLAQTDFKWQYMTEFRVRFWYEHSGVTEKGKNGFATYFDGKNDADKTSETTTGGLGKITAEASISESLHATLKVKKRFDVVYLKGDPGSVKVLNKDGSVSIPALNVFIYICVFLLLCSAFMFVFYRKTGRTF